MAASATELKMKLLVDSNGKKVLFAEVGKDFVDFLFHILSLQLDTVIRLVNKDHKVGCIANLYDSVENLNETYLQNNDMILNPKLPASFASIPLLSLPNAPYIQKTIYHCVYGCCGNCASDGPGARCNTCRNEMRGTMTYVSPPGNTVLGVSEGGGIVKGVVTYYIYGDGRSCSEANVYYFKHRNIESVERQRSWCPAGKDRYSHYG